MNKYTLSALKIFFVAFLVFGFGQTAISFSYTDNEKKTDYIDEMVEEVAGEAAILLSKRLCQKGAIEAAVVCALYAGPTPVGGIAAAVCGYGTYVGCQQVAKQGAILLVGVAKDKLDELGKEKLTENVRNRVDDYAYSQVAGFCSEKVATKNKCSPEDAQAIYRQSVNEVAEDSPFANNIPDEQRMKQVMDGENDSLDESGQTPNKENVKASVQVAMDMMFWSSPTGHFPKGVFILNG